jgi:hypothetical protein
MLNVVMLNVVMLNVVILSVAAPKHSSLQRCGIYNDRKNFIVQALG